MDWSTLNRGSPEMMGNGRETRFSDAHQRCLDTADQLAARYQLNQRLWICDREQVGTALTATRIARLLHQAKESVSATRALLVLDYLNIVEVPDDVSRRSDSLEQDRYRVRLIQDVIAATATPDNPDGDAVLAISEARKPSSAKETWGAELYDIMGSSRLPYAVDAAIVYRSMSLKEIERHYDVRGPEAARARKEQLSESGRSPVLLTLAKGRDGMTRGEWAMEFHFRRSRFESIRRRPQPQLAPLPHGPGTRGQQRRTTRT
jgi:hypothetical protein